MTPRDENYGKRCGCGHVVSDDWQCCNGGVYGPCEAENCYGVCVWIGSCRENENCLCGGGEDDDDDDETPDEGDETARSAA